MRPAGQAMTRSSTAYRPPEHVETLTAMALGALSDAEMRYAPLTLYVAGDIGLLRSRPKVAIVGSRKATDEGRRRAHKLAAGLAEQGVVIVSGLAEGIDRAAHDGAIAAGGATIAVIGTPMDLCYPAAHARLQEKIYTDGLLVSQFPPGHRTYPSDFIKRNRTMALIADASVIVEAHDGSGALSQAAETQRLHRPLFFMRSVLDNPELEWPARFQVNGAQVLTDVAQVLDVVGRRPS